MVRPLLPTDKHEDEARELLRQSAFGRPTMLLAKSLAGLAVHGQFFSVSPSCVVRLSVGGGGKSPPACGCDSLDKPQWFRGKTLRQTGGRKVTYRFFPTDYDTAAAEQRKRASST